MVLPFPPGTTSGIEVLSAACPALTRVGDGSNPSNPTSHALVVQRPRLRTRNADTWVRVPPGALVAGCWCVRSFWRAASHFVHESCSGSVVIAPGGVHSPPFPAEPANQRVGKPGTPRASGARNRRFKSGHADCSSCEVLCWYRPVTVDHQAEGSIPSLAALMVPPSPICGSPPSDEGGMPQIRSWGA